MATRDVMREGRRQDSTATKIRNLAAQGRSRADIARALGIRYQHVRNVLVREEEKARAAESSDPKNTPVKIHVGSDGSAVVPAAAISALSLRQGDPLFVRVHEGEIRLLTKAAVARRVQEAVRQFVPEDVSLVEELLEDRRREVEAETRNG